MISQVDTYQEQTGYNVMVLCPLRRVLMQIHTEQLWKKGVREKYEEDKSE